MTALACNPFPTGARPQPMLHHIVIELPTLPTLSCTAKGECPSSEAGLLRLSAYITTLGCTAAKTGKLVNTGAQNLGSLPMSLLGTAALLETRPDLTLGSCTFGQQRPTWKFGEVCLSCMLRCV